MSLGAEAGEMLVVSPADRFNVHPAELGDFGIPIDPEQIDMLLGQTGAAMIVYAPVDPECMYGGCCGRCPLRVPDETSLLNYPGANLGEGFAARAFVLPASIDLVDPFSNHHELIEDFWDAELLLNWPMVAGWPQSGSDAIYDVPLPIRLWDAYPLTLEQGIRADKQFSQLWYESEIDLFHHFIGVVSDANTYEEHLELNTDLRKGSKEWDDEMEAWAEMVCGPLGIDPVTLDMKEMWLPKLDLSSIDPDLLGIWDRLVNRSRAIWDQMIHIDANNYPRERMVFSPWR